MREEVNINSYNTYSFKIKKGVFPKSTCTSNKNGNESLNSSQNQSNFYEKRKTMGPQKCLAFQNININGNNTIENDSFTQYSHISGINDNHFYSDIVQKGTNEILSNKILTIEDLEGDLFNNQKLFFDSSGLKNGLRGKKDGFAFFGSITHYQGKVINDFVLNLKDDLLNNLKAKIYFAIFYDRTLGKFFFKNVKKLDYNNIPTIDFSCVVFTLKDKEYQLCNKNLISIGKNFNYFLIEILNDNSIKIDILTKGKNNNVESSFCFSTDSSPITIGETGKLHVMKKQNLSVLYYKKDSKKWSLIEKIDEIWVGCDRRIELNKKIKFKMDRDIFEITG